MLMDETNEPDLFRQILGLVASQDPDPGVTADRLAEACALAEGLQDLLSDDPEAFERQAARNRVSEQLPQLIGEVVIAAARAEDAAGTLLQSRSGDPDRRAVGYDDSSSRLVTALRDSVPAELADRFASALKLRHFVVHGVWVNGSFVSSRSDGKPSDFVSLKRRYRTKAPEMDMKPFMKSDLEALAREFWEIEDELERLHSQVLFGEGESE